MKPTRHYRLKGTRQFSRKQHAVVLIIFVLQHGTKPHEREPDSGIREIFACGIRNLGLWNPEYSPRNQEFL